MCFIYANSRQKQNWWNFPGYYTYIYSIKKINTVQIYMQFSIGHVYSCLYLIVIVQA